MHTLIAFFDDLIWTPRLTVAAETLGIQAEFIGLPAALWEALSQESDLTPEILTALRRTFRGSWSLMEYLTRKQPVLLLFDLGRTAIPWESYLPRVSTATETRHLPILCFGPHVQVEKIQQTRLLGAAAVVSRSRLETDMPALLLYSPYCAACPEKGKQRVHCISGFAICRAMGRISIHHCCRGR